MAKQLFSETLSSFPISTKVLSMIEPKIMSERFIMPVEFNNESSCLTVVTNRYNEVFRDAALVTAIIRREHPEVKSIFIKEIAYENFIQGYSAHYREPFVSSAINSGFQSSKNIEQVTSEQTKLAQDILRQAIEANASDIHITPFKDGSRITFRVDGKMRDSGMPPISIEDEIMVCNIYKRNCSIEVSNLVAQDGRFSMFGKDFRLATTPFGDSGMRNKVVMRVIGSAETTPAIENLGFEEEDVACFKRMIHQPSGILLVCGPTGEGKSTTLYACIRELNNKADSVIVTIEDPIEKYIDGVSQSQVHYAEIERNNYDFNKAMKSFLRADPDVMMVGEIRDQATALTAVQASQTGHLIMSTLHVRNSISVFRRLHDMGANVSGFTEQIVGISSQRLLSVNCPHCKKKVVSRFNSMLRKQDLEKLEYGIDANGNEGYISYESSGCTECNRTGILKRIPLVEIIEFNNFLRDYFAGNHGLIEIERYLRKNCKFRSLWDRGMEHVAMGDFSLEELVNTIPVDVDLTKEYE